MDPISAGIGAAGSVVGSVFNWLDARAQRDFQEEQARLARALAGGYIDDARNTFLMPQISTTIGNPDDPGTMYQNLAMWRGAAMPLWDQMMAMQQGIPGMFQGMQQYMPPAIENNLNHISGIAGELSDPRYTAQQLFQGGGWTPYRQDFNDRLMEMINGGRGIGTMSDIGQRLLNLEGKTNFTNVLQDRGADAVNSGGMNPYLDAAMSKYLGLSDNPSSQQSALGQEAALKLLGASGATPANVQRLARGTNLENREALLPTEMAMSMAREQAGGDFDKQMEAVRARALARGGGPGAVVASGGQTGAEADFAKDRLQYVADRGQKALMDQQGLNLQQMGMGSGIANSAQADAINRMGIGASLLPALQGQDTQRLLGALGGIGGVVNTATQRAGTFGNLGLGGAQNELARLMGGGQLTGASLDQISRALGLLEQGTTNQQQIALGGGNLMNTLANSQAGMFDDIVKQYFNANTQGLNNFNTLYGAQNTSMGNQRAMTNDFWNQYMQSMNPATNAANNYFGFGNTILGGSGAMPNPASYTPVSSPWGAIAGGVGQFLQTQMNNRSNPYPAMPQLPSSRPNYSQTTLFPGWGG